ncbi:MAG: DUF3108 domain-containing protein [Polyangia bacterium]
MKPQLPTPLARRVHMSSAARDLGGLLRALGLGWVGLGLGVGVLAVAAPVHAGAAARRGEAFTFTVKILGAVDAGRARLAVNPPQAQAGGHVIQVVGEAEATGMAKALTSWHQDYKVTLDAATLLPQKVSLHETGKRQRDVNFVINGRTVDMDVRRPDQAWRAKAEMPVELLDPVGVLLLLRVARLRDGDKLALVVSGGSALYSGTVQVVAREEVALPTGPRRAIRLACRGIRVDEKGIEVGRTPWLGTLWLSDDKARLPLRVAFESEIGPIEFTMTSHEGISPPLPRTLRGVIENGPLPRPATAPAPAAAPVKPAAPAPGAAPTPGAPPAPAAKPATPAAGAPATTPSAAAKPATTPATPAAGAPATAPAPAAKPVTTPAAPAASAPATAPAPAAKPATTTAPGAPAAAAPAVKPAAPPSAAPATPAAAAPAAVKPSPAAPPPATAAPAPSPASPPAAAPR